MLIVRVFYLESECYRKPGRMTGGYFLKGCRPYYKGREENYETLEGEKNDRMARERMNGIDR